MLLNDNIEQINLDIKSHICYISTIKRFGFLLFMTIFFKAASSEAGLITRPFDTEQAAFFCEINMRKGSHHTEETKQKMSNMRKGRISPLKGRHLSEEHKRNIGKGGKGRHPTIETRRKLSEWQRGKNNPNWKGGKKAQQERQKKDLKFQLNKRIKCSIYQHIRKRSKANHHWCNLVGYTVTELKKRLKSTMPGGYTWTNFLSGDLHIDHIIPVSAFNFDTPGHLDFKRCYALSNLQLLPASENHKKRAKIIKTFQPSLKL